MRVTQEMPQTQLLSNLNNLMSTILSEQQQLASGQAIQQPSDNPVATGQYLNITAAQAWNTQWTQNAQTASSYMSTANNAMTQLTSLLQTAHTIATQANSGTVSQPDLQAQATQVGELVQQAQSLANTQYGSQYVFGGASGSAPWDSTSATWNLTASPATTNFEVGSGVTIPASVDGYALFQGPVGGGTTAGLLTGNGASATPGVLEQLQSDLQSGNTANLGSDIKALGNAINYVSSMQSDLGARMQRVTAVTSTLQSVGVQLSSQAAQVDSTNMPQVLMQLTNQQAVYQAALDIGAKSLMPTLATLIG